MKFIRDEDFIRGSIPMTKYDIRVVTLSLLDIEDGDRFLDVGAGTGSVSVQAALMGAEVYAVEREAEGVSLIKENSRRFHSEVFVCEGSAPEAIPNDIMFTKCFVGGSGGNMEDIVKRVAESMEIGGIIAANFVTLNNMVRFRKSAEENGFDITDVRLIQSSLEEKRTGILRANNPVFIIRGIKG